MKRINFALLLVVICSVTAGAQQINKVNPFGGAIREKFVAADSKVMIDIELLKELDASLSVPVASITDLKMTVTGISTKQSNGETLFNSLSRPATLLSDEDSDATTRTFQLEISTATTISPGTPLRLPKNWESFSYRISCNFNNDPSTTKTTAELNMQKPSSGVVGQNFNVKIDRPVWIREANGTRSNEIMLPITSNSAFLVADVSVTQNGQESKTPKPVLLEKGEPTVVRLNAQNFGDGAMVVRIKPTELQGVQLLLSGTNCSSSQDDPNCTVMPEFKLPFKINKEASDFGTLEINSLAQPRTIKFVTTTPPKSGTLTVKLNGNAVDVNSTDVNSFRIVLDVAALIALKQGDNTFEVEGESLEGIKLANERFTFKKTTEPKLEGFPTFSLDNDALKLNYELSGDVEVSRPQITYRSTGGTAATFQNVNCTPDTTTKRLKCSPDFNIVSPGGDLGKAALIPVKLEIFATERGGTSKLLDTIGFDLLNQRALKTLLDDIRAAWKQNGNDNLAKQKISDVLKVELTNDKVNETFEKFVKPADSSDKRKKFFQFLTSVGNFALKGFGIPITIPTDLGQ
jgi:hypothetical protein